MKYIIGVDPGVKGGMAMLSESGAVVSVYAFEGQNVKEVIATMQQWADYIKKESDCHNVYLEKVSYIKGDGGMGAFTFGKVYGGLLFGFSALGLYVVHVPPTLWMSRMECMTGGNKDVTWNKAKGMWPAVFSGKLKGWGLGVADALLIAEYGRRGLCRP